MTSTLGGPHDSTDDSNEIAASLDAVTHHYGKVQALDDLHLTVARGEVLAVLGPNGAGKTTAIELLLGSLPVQRGTAQVLGGRPRSAAVRARRGAMLQRSGVPGTLKVAEHIDLFRTYYPDPLPAARLIEMAGLEEITGRRFEKLSGGQKQRVMFALALAGNPELVFLDEPTTGLDVEARRRMWAEIRALKDAGRTVVLTTPLPRRGRRPRRPHRGHRPGARARRGYAGRDQGAHGRQADPLCHAPRSHDVADTAGRDGGGGQRQPH